MTTWFARVAGALPKHALPIPRPGGTLLGEVVRVSSHAFDRIRIACNHINKPFFQGLFQEHPTVTVEVDADLSGPLGPAVRSLLQDRCRTYLCGGDVFCDIEWSVLEAFHESHDLPITIVAARSSPTPSAACFEVTDHRVVAWQRRTCSTPGDLINIGFYILDATDEVPTLLAGLDRHSESHFFDIMVSRGLLAAYVCPDFAFNVNTPETYRNLLAHAVEPASRPSSGRKEELPRWAT